MAEMIGIIMIGLCLLTAVSLGNGCVIKAGRRKNKGNDDGKGNKEWNP